MTEETNRRVGPTDKMLSYAEKISNTTGVPLPAEVRASYDECKAFIDANADKVSPSQAALDYALKLSEATGAAIPDDVKTSARKLSGWIEEHK